MEPEGSLPHSQKPATCSYLSQIDLVHAPFLFSKIHFNIILYYALGSPKWSPYLRPAHQNPPCTTLLPARATCPFQSSSWLNCF